MASSIEWLGGGNTWNPIRARLKEDMILTGRDGKKGKALMRGKKGWACVRISPGCQHCYSEAQNEHCGTNPTRAGTGLKYDRPSLSQVEIYLDEKTLLAPLHWKKPRLIFPCSMTDWMADFVPDEFRDKMLAVMALTPQHTYLTLTKRAGGQRKYLTGLRREGDTKGYVQTIFGRPARFFPSEFKNLPLNNEARLPWPLPNLWLGTSAEDQQRADERIPLLLQTPATIRWASVEPMLEAIEFSKIPFHLSENRLGLLNWIVCGGESGPGARPFNIEWARQIVAQCQAAHVPVFVKQLGSKPFLHKQESVNIDKPGFKFSMQSLEINSTFKLNDRKGGDMQEWPTDLQVRQYPEVAYARS